jgi:membrane protease subunit HflC
MTKLTTLAVALFVALFLTFNAAFIIDQAEQGIIVQFGEPIGDVITEPGLHWRVPFVQEVRRFDKRLLAWNGDVSQIPTLGREFIIVDTTARWRISDPLQFLRSVRDETGARTRLDDILDSVSRDIVSGTDLEEIVRSADWQVNVEALDEEELAALGEASLERPTKGRGQLEQEMLAAASRLMPGLGIELVDVRIKRINYIDSVRVQVESRMISERQSIAARFRSEGQGRSEEILGDMERQLRLITSEAERKAQEIIAIAR